jgi:aminoglycoside phosphotransferase (APT) family kinase protein
MEAVPGVDVKELLACVPEPAALDLVERAAHGLAGLHALSIVTDERRSIAGDVSSIRARASRFPLVVPELAAEVEHLLKRVEARAESYRPVDASFLHGDYKPSQLLWDGEHLTLVDFDRAALGDPSIDVGNFMAQMRKEALLNNAPQLRRLADAFLSAYQAAGGAAGIAPSARFIECLSLVRLAVRQFRHAPHEYVVAPAGSLTTAFLREAEECLGRL